jgi:MFS family permease
VLNAFAGFCQSFAMPGIQSYAVTIIPSQAGAIIGLIQLIMFAFAGVLIWGSTELANLMGYGWLFTAMALIEVFSAGAVVWLSLKRLRDDKAIDW